MKRVKRMVFVIPTMSDARKIPVAKMPALVVGGMMVDSPDGRISIQPVSQTILNVPTLAVRCARISVKTHVKKIQMKYPSLQ